MSVPLEASLGAHPWRIHFSGAQCAVEKELHALCVDAPCLGGACTEEIFFGAQLQSEAGALRLFEAGELLLGCGSVAVDASTLETQTARLYAEMVQACKDHQLYRVWNYVPRINEETAGLEQYRAFCRGRSTVFENTWGPSYKRFLPAASAVGCDDSRFALVFAAGKAVARHIENPEQVPAYDYPAEHGPKAPSFSRSTVGRANGQDYVFISGTAAIKGHATIAPGAFDQQVACTLDNLRLISKASGTSDDLGRAQGWTRHFKIYLRNAADYSHARGLLEGVLVHEEDRVTWLRSDVCRAALNIEVEATLVR